MRVLGFACGTGANSEILLKAALMATEAAGHTVELVNVGTLDLPAARPGTLPPGTPDDRPWLTEALIACDALIVSAPVYSRSPAAPLKMVIDRAFGPRIDVAAIMRAKQGKFGGAPHTAAFTDDRLLKPRVGALISVGGASSADWVTFGLPLMHMAMFSMQIAVVDQVQFLAKAPPGAVLLDPATMARATALGQHVAQEIGKPCDQAIYHGAPGICPVCHCDLIVPHAHETECATCAARGTLSFESGQPRLLLTDAGRARSILTIEGKMLHQEEIETVGRATMPRMPEVAALRAPYDAWQRPVQRGVE